MSLVDRAVRTQTSDSVLHPAPLSAQRTIRTSLAVTHHTSARRDSGHTSAATRPPAEAPLVVVGIGASAVGLDALQTVLAQLPAESGMAFLVVSHPYPSPAQLGAVSLRELVVQNTRMAVIEPTRCHELEPNHVYVAPPGHQLSLRPGRCDVLELTPSALPIDHLFRSMADSYGQHAAALILSGSNSDGAIGMAQVKAAGGLAMVQLPSSAGFRGRLTNALTHTPADFVLPPDQLAAKLLAFFAATAPPASSGRRPGQEAVDREAARVITFVQEHTGQNFSAYRRPQVVERLHRRMQVYGLTELPDYLTLLETTPSELDMLTHELRFRGASFGRDQDAYPALIGGLDDYLKRRPQQRKLRVWVPACASGEQAYALAMVLLEFLERRTNPPSLQIFGTDIDARGIEIARGGLYPNGIAMDVGREHLSRFFARETDLWRARRVLRDPIVFATHDVVDTPALTRIDLILCRDLFLCLDTELHSTLLSTFWRALSAGGLLFVGSSVQSELLTGAFRSLGASSGLAVKCSSQPLHVSSSPSPRMPKGSSVRGALAASPAALGVGELVDSLLVTCLVPPTVLAAPHGDILYIHGRTGRFLEPAPGEPSINLFSMAREGLRLELPAAIRQAQQAESPVVKRGLQVWSNGSFEPVTLTVTPLKEPASMRGMLLVTFQTESLDPTLAEHEHAQSQAEIENMRHDLAMTMEELESAHLELSAVSDQLKHTTEELHERQEESHVRGEQLLILNAELEQATRELGRTNDDVSNLLRNSDAFTVFLDKQLHIRLFSPKAAELLGLSANDLGRPLSAVRTMGQSQVLVEEARDLLNAPQLGEVEDGRGRLGPTSLGEVEVSLGPGESYRTHLLPYRKADHTVDGFILTLDAIRPLDSARDATRALTARSELKANTTALRQSLSAFIRTAGRMHLPDLMRFKR